MSLADQRIRDMQTMLRLLRHTITDEIASQMEAEGRSDESVLRQAGDMAHDLDQLLGSIPSAEAKSPHRGTCTNHMGHHWGYHYRRRYCAHCGAEG